MNIIIVPLNNIEKKMTAINRRSRIIHTKSYFLKVDNNLKQRCEF